MNVTGIAQFTTTGDAAVGTCNCYDVTADAVSENGSFHKTPTINLNVSFNFEFLVNFGCEPTGGEGLAFVLKSGAWALGSGGFGLGYQAIPGNVLAIEFDTRDNDASGEIDNLDVPGDHISLQDNGDIYHEPTNPNNLLGTPSGLNIGEVATPHNIKPGFPNIEDCEDHLVEISWTPGANQTLQVKVDGVVTMTYIGNMIAAQFGGNPNVLWGWTGSTSTFKNQQTVCMALVSDYSFSATACPGEVINFTDESFGFFSITDWDWDFDGLGTSTASNPTFTFDDPGIHEVELKVTDSQGCESTITKEIMIGFDTEVDVDDPTVCIGESTILHALGTPYTGTECCFKLVLNDLWGDFWGSGIENEVEIIADGVSFGFYTPTSYDPGSGTSDTIDLCFEQDTELEFIIHGADTPAECSYFFLAEDLTEIIAVDGITPGTWLDGATETYTVDCGLVAPAYTYLWDNPALLSDETIANPTATIFTDTWFHVEITDPLTGCTIVDSIEVTVNPPVTATISGTDVICDGDLGELTIAFTGASPYEIDIYGPSGALPTITGILVSPYTLNVGEDGDYVIIFVTGDGCEGTFSGTGTIDVIVPFSIEIEASASYCEGDPMTDLVVTSTGGGTVNWYDNPGLIPPVIGTGLTFTPPAVLGTFTYYAAETEGVLGCEGPADEVTIAVNPIPLAPAYFGLTEFCEGDVPTAIVGDPTLGGTMTWYDGMPPGGAVLFVGASYFPPVVAPGMTVYLTETAAGCESPATEVVITVYITPDPPVVVGDLEYCEGDLATALIATIGSGGTIRWESEAGILLGTGVSYVPDLVVGSTVIEVYEVLGVCESDPTSVTVVVQALPTVVVPESLSICLGDSIRVTAENNGYDITWSDGQTGETVWLGPEITTFYIVTATNPACGSAIDELTLTVHPLPDISTSNDSVIGLGGGVNLWALSEEAISYTWSPEILECLEEDCSKIYDVPNQPTVYVVFVEDKNGCVNSDSILVDMNGVMEVFVPNVFSPNGDGSNDFLIVYGPRLFNFNFEIYDRWGKKIFESKDQSEAWDGRFNEKVLPPQTFVYVVTGQTVFGTEVKKEGNVTIIK